jgi:hypothetical protein
VNAEHPLTSFDCRVESSTSGWSVMLRSKIIAECTTWEEAETVWAATVRTLEPYVAPSATIEINPPAEAWEEIGDCEREDADPRSRLLATVYIYGQLHHLDAIEVFRPVEGDMYVAANRDFAENLDRLYEGFDPGEEYEPTEIDGRKYVLFMDPGC